MGIQRFTNNASTTLAADITSGATAMIVASGALFPTSLTNGDWFIVTLQEIVDDLVTAQEIVKVTAVSGVNWTMVRDQEGTGSQPWFIGNTVAMLPSAGTVANFVQQIGITAAETAASVTPTNLQYVPGNVLRYGADPTGSTDSAAAINNALLCNSEVFDSAGGTFACSASLLMHSNQTLKGVGAGTVFQFATSIDNILLSGITGSVLRDFKINVTSTTPAEVGGAHILNSSYNTIERVQMVGCTWSGVWLDAASNFNVVRGCKFSGFSEPAGSGGDIMIYSIHGGGTTAPCYNHFEGNICNGGGGYGIAIQDPYAAGINGFPTRNTAIGNKIGAHISYGMLIYMPGDGAGPADTYNTFIGNKVENIQGSTPTDDSTGAGIYMVGNGIGGSQVIGNSVLNCCIDTVNRSLAPAGISVAGCQTGLTPPLIADNAVAFMTQGDGILVTSSPGGATVIGNNVNMPSNNTGAGPGDPSLAGTGIRVEASSNVVIGPNQVWAYGSGSALFLYANGVNNANIVINGGLYVTGSLSTSPAFFTQQAGGFNVTQVQMSGARFITQASGNDAMSLNSMIAVTLGNCAGNAAGARGLYINTSTGVRVSGGQYTTTGSVSIATSGLCTGGFIDKSVNFGGNESLIDNAGTGSPPCNIELRANTAPSSGTWAIGDHVQQSIPVVGQEKGWYCTVAGTPGTWPGEGNL
jgi:hypothetical protein